MNNYRNQKLTQVILASAIISLSGSIYSLTVNAQESQQLNTIRNSKIKLQQQSNIQITGNITNDPNAPAISCSNLTVEIIRLDRSKAGGGFDIPVETKLGSTSGSGATTAATCQYSISISPSPNYVKPRPILIRATGGGLSGKEVRSTSSLQSSQNIDITLYNPPVIK
jgi:hypothetical protein